ncbi:MAG: hypothetical protein D6812_12230 [Deltaproteobacteria bacterium]|nr:MAG: hypothetical protein D6812_12230 [Deltaproteobacteria bacterium]
MTNLKVIPGGRDPDRRVRLVFIWSLLIGIILSGVAFALKVTEFIYTMSSEEAKGFADVPVTVYFFIAAGWLCLLVWCFLTGKFKEMEREKYDLIELEERYEREGI